MKKVTFLMTLGFLITSNTSLFCMQNSLQALQDEEDYLESLMDTSDNTVNRQGQFTATPKKAIKATEIAKEVSESQTAEYTITVYDPIKIKNFGFLGKIKKAKKSLYRMFLNLSGSLYGNLCVKNKKSKNNFSCGTCAALTVLTCCNGYPTFEDCFYNKNK